MSFICIEENSSEDEIVGLTEMFITRYEFLKYYCSSKILTSYTFLSLPGGIYYSDFLCYLIYAVLFSLRKEIIELYTWDTIDQASSMKAFQPTIIDPAEAPKPLVTHTAV